MIIDQDGEICSVYHHFPYHGLDILPLIHSDKALIFGLSENFPNWSFLISILPCCCIVMHFFSSKQTYVPDQADASNQFRA
jgi:hypothetical protein